MLYNWNEEGSVIYHLWYWEATIHLFMCTHTYFWRFLSLKKRFCPVPKLWSGLLQKLYKDVEWILKKSPVLEIAFPKHCKNVMFIVCRNLFNPQ